MSVHQPALEALGDHDYLVRFAAGRGHRGRARARRPYGGGTDR